MKGNVKYLSIQSSFVSVCKNLARSPLDYCNCVWTPCRKSDIGTLEKVQEKATEIVWSSESLYRFTYVILSTDQRRWLKHKILTSKCDMVAAPNLTTATTLATWGNDLRLQKSRTQGIICVFLPRCMECRRGLAMRILSVRLSVRLSNACIVTKRKKDVFIFLYHTK